MIRNNLLNLLQEYKPTESEVKNKQDIINFVNKYSNCFERSLEIGHITASAWLLSKDMSKALLMHHNKLDIWVQVGGHCDGNPNVLEVAIKEAQEESGINNITPVSDKIFDIDIHLVPDYKNVKAHYHYDIRFLLRVNSNEDFVQNSESKELRWVRKNINDLPTQEPNIVRLFNKWETL